MNTARSKAEIDQDDLDAACSMVLDEYPEAASLRLQTSDQSRYGFTVVQVKDGDNYEIDESREDWGEVQEHLMNLDWDGVVGEDKHGYAAVDLTVYDVVGGESRQHFANTGRYLRRTAMTLPYPNDPFDGGIVVASVWMRDEEPPITALLMLLRPQPPYYEIADIEWVDGAWSVYNRIQQPNINPATETFAQQGGDY